jgi:hypothetical protein
MATLPFPWCEQVHWKLLPLLMPAACFICHASFLGWNQHDPIYTAYQHFMASLYKDWAVRTENPWEANLFYVPALTYFYSGKTGTRWESR